jgi:hypothetical protein
LPERAAENDHLSSPASTKEKLVETFKSLITQTRETHVKQLAIATADGAASPEVDIFPSSRSSRSPRSTCARRAPMRSSTSSSGA